MWNPITHYISIYDEISSHNSLSFHMIFTCYSIFLLVICITIGSFLLLAGLPRWSPPTTTSVHATSTARNDKILTDCPILQEYTSHLFLRIGHVQTVLLTRMTTCLFPKVEYTRKVFTCHDTGIIALDWAYPNGIHVQERPTMVNIYILHLQFFLISDR